MWLRTNLKGWCICECVFKGRYSYADEVVWEQVQSI